MTKDEIFAAISNNMRLKYPDCPDDITEKNENGAFIDFVVLDFETTGLSPQKDYIIQIGAVKFNNNIPCGKFITYVKPPIHIPPSITQLTGISDLTVETSPNIEILLPKLISFIGDCPIVCHNATFDISFLVAASNKYNIDIPNNIVIDTLPLSKKCIKDTSDHRLSTLKNYLKINNISHDALADCLTTGKLYTYCLSLNPKITRKTISSYISNINASNNNSIPSPTETELNYYRVIIQILKSFSADVSEIVCLRNNSYFTILDAYPIAKFKFGAKLSYWLVEYPLEELIKIAPNDIQCVRAPKSESPRAIRVFINSADDLFAFKNVIKEKYRESQKMKENYYKYFSAERYFEGEFRISSDML